MRLFLLLLFFMALMLYLLDTLFSSHSQLKLFDKEEVMGVVPHCMWWVCVLAGTKTGLSPWSPFFFLSVVEFNAADPHWLGCTKLLPSNVNILPHEY